MTDESRESDCEKERGENAHTSLDHPLTIHPRETERNYELKHPHRCWMHAGIFDGDSASEARLLLPYSTPTKPLTMALITHTDASLWIPRANTRDDDSPEPMPPHTLPNITNTRYFHRLCVCVCVYEPHVGAPHRWICLFVFQMIVWVMLRRVNARTGGPAPWCVVWVLGSQWRMDTRQGVQLLCSHLRLQHYVQPLGHPDSTLDSTD
ncbi:hypothetical protein QLX08_009858 [Tetragonisca angustula]|uniref:Uncharacterized protein n=1 Tax=Tetragonisca angustula TaxID=166442 RepID=A0AAW0ZFD8_9HYME